ncbi:sugar phosphate isomerase/epimerase, partial [Paracoccaceae bacterium]|nr:sugar phosphate isomerase/epimerase [Paracoccaceae bacterium]
MQGFGVHTSMWTMHWDRLGAERTIPAAAAYKMDFIEIALLDTSVVDAHHTRDLLAKHEMRAVCSLGLPRESWASVNPDGAITHLIDAMDYTKEMGGEALSGVTYGGIGERSGVPPTEAEYDNIARALEVAAKYAKTLGIAFGIEPVNRYESHLINTSWQAKEMIDKIGAD